MDKRCIQSPNGPPAQGPYSHAVAVTGLLFVSGQGPFAPDGSGVQKGAFADEARLTLANLKTVLEDAGARIEDVVKVTVFLSDMDNFIAFNEIYKKFFRAECPARSCVEVARLPLDIQVEVEAIAALPAATQAPPHRPGVMA